MGQPSIDQTMLQELLYQSLETEMVGINVYECAVCCALDAHLKAQWSVFLEETLRHREVLLGVFNDLGLDANTQTAGRRIVAGIGAALVSAMQQALADGDALAAQRIAGECVCLAETKDQLNWELIGMVALNSQGPYAKVLKRAYERVHRDESLHMNHGRGWTRELWLHALGLDAELPLPDVRWRGVGLVPTPAL